MCSAGSLERIVQPALADLQHEYAAAESVLSRLWILCRGYAAALRIIVVCIFGREAFEADRRVIIRTLGWTAGSITATTALLLIPPIVIAMASGPLPVGRSFLLMLVPQAIPLAIPLGVIFGVAMGLVGRTLTPQVKKAVIGVALSGAVVSFANMAWLMPAANQAFRQSVFVARGGQGAVMKGASEMSLSELRRAGGHGPGGDRMSWPTRVTWTYHLRVALAFAGPALSMLALALIDRGARRWLVMATCLAYYALLWTGEAIVYGGAAPWAGAWLANAAIGMTAVALWYGSSAAAAAISDRG
jgi:hypothetical protein